MILEKIENNNEYVLTKDFNERIELLEKKNEELKEEINNYSANEIITNYERQQESMRDLYDKLVSNINIGLIIVTIVCAGIVAAGSFIIPIIRLKNLEQNIKSLEHELENSKSVFNKEIHKRLKEDKENRNIETNKRFEYFYITQDVSSKDYTGALNKTVKYIDKYREICNQNELCNLYSLKGFIYNEIDYYLDAISQFSIAIEINSGFSLPYNYRGIAYVNLKQYEKAIDDYSEAIKLDSKDATSYNNRGNTYADLKQYEKAIDDYSEAIKLNPKYAMSYNNRGNAYADLKQYEKAIDDYSEAIKLDPKDATYYNNRGNTYADLKQYEKAINDINKALQIDDGSYYIYEAALEIYYQFNKEEQFFQLLDVVVKIIKNSKDRIKDTSFYEKYKDDLRFLHILE